MTDSISEAGSTCEAVIAAADFPVFVVTTRAGEETSGCLVGFTAQVSINPLRFLVGLSQRNHTHRVAQRAERLNVHLLGQDQVELAALFGSETGDEIDKFARCAWHPDSTGLPVLSAAAGWFGGKILERHDFGDHTVMLLAPDTGVAPPADVETLRFLMVDHLEPGHDA
ncbi:flavin reductase family protein [Nocardia harenae]|uniref:flavin reductase family protein n=1 Tax=Nocardia harenae TaxID=358707 RepID=UPI00083624A8|nr:flavin reductase family protein [Nocardia harenae]